jgi:Cd2+/Zn2+-exporting ATPase
MADCCDDKSCVSSLSAISSKGCGCPDNSTKSTEAKTFDAGRMENRFRIENMDCPTEEALIRHKLVKLPGVTGLEFNLMQRLLTVRHELASLEPIERALSEIGMQAVRVDADSQNSIRNTTAVISMTPHTKWWPLILSGLAATLAEGMYWFLGGNHWSVMIFALFAVFTGGLSTYKKGWIALKNRNLNMNALMSIAVTGAMLIGQWPEAAMVMVLFALAEVIEEKSLNRARNAIRGLLDLAPERTTVRQPDGSWVEVESKTVDIDSRVRVKPGERIALDGVIVQGNSTVNQAPITGESLPLEKTVGDLVFAGTINESGSFEYRVTAVATQSTLARIIHAVEVAQGSRAPTQRFVDQFARLYTPIVFSVALAVAILPPLVLAEPWLAWVYKALVLLVIACPCALVISTPVSIVSGLAAAARHGILIKGGAYLEEGRKLTWIALDKTGTITHGKPEQTDFIVWDDTNASSARIVAASLAARSDHPVSLAIARMAQTEQLVMREVSDFSALLGRGVQGRIDGAVYFLGNHRMVKELGVSSPDLEVRLTALEAQGKTVVMLCSTDHVQALFAVADTTKNSSRNAIAELHTLGVKTIMLTGDNSETAAAIASQVGIDRSLGNLLPEDKLHEIERLAQSGKVGMVGDGINDAPALARADIGFAMGAAGSGTAIETADVALMDDDLRKLPTFVRLSRATGSVLKQNIFLALLIKAAFLVLTFTGQGAMWMAVFADMGASLLVVGNGLRLLRR